MKEKRNRFWTGTYPTKKGLQTVLLTSRDTWMPNMLSYKSIERKLETSLLTMKRNMLR